MSFSVDELVSSLSSSHIGQEAIDLAAFQEYLYNTGFGMPANSSRDGLSRRPSYEQPCNTPTFQSSASAWLDTTSSHRVYHDDEDERMVEDLLLHQPPPSPSTSLPNGGSISNDHDHHHHFRHYGAVASSPPQSSSMSTYPGFTSRPISQQDLSFPSTSATADPFYTAQLQASQNYSTWGSAIAGQQQQPHTSALHHQSSHHQHPSAPIPTFDNRRNANLPALSIDSH